MGGPVLIAAGANLVGRFGPPADTLRRCLDAFAARNLRVMACSRLYRSPPAGGMRQPDYLNCIFEVTTPLPPDSLLAVLKSIEADAGRRPQPAWSPRPLDLDIICFKARIHNWQAGPFACPRTNRTRLILPHPGAHQRRFVLQPLAELRPDWHHPVFGLTPAALLKRLGLTARALEPASRQGATATAAAVAVAARKV